MKYRLPTFVSLELRIPSMKLLTSVTPDLVSAMPLVRSSTLVLVASTSAASVSFFARRAITFSVSLCDRIKTNNRQFLSPNLSVSLKLGLS